MHTCYIKVPHMFSAVPYRCAEPASLLEWMLGCCHCGDLPYVSVSQESGSASVDGGVDTAKVAELERRLAAQSAETQKIQVRQKIIHYSVAQLQLMLSALLSSN